MRGHEPGRQGGERPSPFKASSFHEQEHALPQAYGLHPLSELNMGSQVELGEKWPLGGGQPTAEEVVVIPPDPLPPVGPMPPVLPAKSALARRAQDAEPAIPRRTGVLFAASSMPEEANDADAKVIDISAHGSHPAARPSTDVAMHSAHVSYLLDTLRTGTHKLSLDGGTLSAPLSPDPLSPQGRGSSFFGAEAIPLQRTTRRSGAAVNIGPAHLAVLNSQKTAAQRESGRVEDGRLPPVLGGHARMKGGMAARLWSALSYLSYFTMPAILPGDLWYR